MFTCCGVLGGGGSGAAAAGELAMYSACCRLLSPLAMAGGRGPGADSAGAHERRGRVGGESSRVAETRLPKRMGQVWAEKSKGHDVVGRKPIGTAYSFSFFRNIIRETAAAAMLDATRDGISASVFTASEATCLMPLFIFSGKFEDI